MRYYIVMNQSGKYLARKGWSSDEKQAVAFAKYVQAYAAALDYRMQGARVLGRE